MRLHWWSYSQKYLLFCYGAQLIKTFFYFCVHTTLIILLISFLTFYPYFFFSFSFISIHPSLSSLFLSISTLSFSLPPSSICTSLVDPSRPFFSLTKSHPFRPTHHHQPNSSSSSPIFEAQLCSSSPKLTEALYSISHRRPTQATPHHHLCVCLFMLLLILNFLKFHL